MALKASDFALIDDRVLDDEDEDTKDLEQALRWVRVYGELLTVAMKTEPQRPAANETLKRQADLYSRRLAVWRHRSQAIADRYP